jgi:hypothetical protein
MVHLAILIVLYFLPAIIGRNKHNATGIFLLNFFLGWTVIGWVIAFIWACAAQPYCVRLIPATVTARFCCRCGSPTCPGAYYCAACGYAV